MLKMSSVANAISKTRTDAWTSTHHEIKSSPLEDFCINHCPHPSDECTGDCKEMKSFRGLHKGEKMHDKAT